MKPLKIGQSINFALKNPEGPNKGTGIVERNRRADGWVTVKVTSLEYGTGAGEIMMIHVDEILD